MRTSTAAREGWPGAAPKPAPCVVTMPGTPTRSRSTVASSILNRPGLAPSAWSTCMSACEACLVACGACVGAERAAGEPMTAAMADALVCMQLCELALHAMANGAVIAPAACAACARSCEKLARDCMLLSQPEYRLCARACYRAARECDRLAATAPQGTTADLPSSRTPGAVVGLSRAPLRRRALAPRKPAWACAPARFPAVEPQVRRVDAR